MSGFSKLKALKPKNYWTSPNAYGEDGVDHINIHRGGKLHIGRFLDPSHARKLTTDFGQFSSIMNLIVWLRHPTLDDETRTMSKRAIHRLIKANVLAPLQNYRLVLCYYTYKKVMNDPTALNSVKQLRDDTVLLSYNKPKDVNVKITTGSADIVLPVMNEIVKAIKESREPDWSMFIDGKFNTDKFIPNEIKAIVDEHYNKE